jgi:hypothetical protein
MCSHVTSCHARPQACSRVDCLRHQKLHTTPPPRRATAHRQLWPCYIVLKTSCHASHRLHVCTHSLQHAACVCLSPNQQPTPTLLCIIQLHSHFQHSGQAYAQKVQCMVDLSAVRICCTGKWLASSTSGCHCLLMIQITPTTPTTVDNGTHSQQFHHAMVKKPQVHVLCLSCRSLLPPKSVAAAIPAVMLHPASQPISVR